MGRLSVICTAPERVVATRLPSEHTLQTAVGEKDVRHGRLVSPRPSGMLPSMVQAPPTRVAPRHPLPLDLRFFRDGALRRGATENVSASGMYVRAAHVPSAGEVITITRLPRAGEVRAEIIAEVRWGRSTPTLDQPEPGFGVRFSEIYAAEENREGLLTLLESLGLDRAQTRLAVERRGEARLAVCHFPLT